jgi:anti-anti-sigma regulatory factor
MASNFTIRHQRREGSLHINLIGDFDGTSAYELKHCLQKALDREKRVIVHTDRLASLPAFGREMFQKQFSAHSRITSRVVFTGAYAQAIAPDGCPTQ